MGKLLWRDTVAQTIRRQAPVGVMECTNELFNASQELAPFDDGELTLGARISTEGADTDSFTTCVSYGNNETSRAYALRQHEDLSYEHTQPECAKFLEKAFEAQRDSILSSIARSIIL